jgi:hypothetical protein
LGALGLVVVGAGLAACNLTSMVQGNDPPDAVDRVRDTDLAPRFPGGAEVANTGSPKGPRASTYYGSANPIEVTAPVARNAGEGYELNFENTPVTTVAKGAWNTIALPAASITAGTKYWIAILSPTGSAGAVAFRDLGAGTKSVMCSTTSLAALPATWISGAAYANSPMTAYVTP